MRHLIGGAAALAVVFILIALPTVHTHVLPEAMCGNCHGPGILNPLVMSEEGEPFTGPDPCEPCHTNEYHIWTRSDHCRAMMRPGRTTVFSAFSPDTVEFGYRGFSTRMVSSPDGYTMIAPGPDGVTRPYPIDLVLGIRDHQVFLTKFPDGRYQVLPSTYDMQWQTWFDATDGLVVSDHTLAPDEPYYWTNRNRCWNRECFDCHLSGMRKNYDPVTNTYNTTWRDLGIDCEACHGPGRPHARLRAIDGTRDTLEADTTLVKLQDLSPVQQVEVCGQCHARKVVLAQGYQPGDDFYEFYEIGLLDDNLVMPDGRYWGMMYDMMALMQSPCYEKGQITCTHCHDGHGTKRRNDLHEFENDDQMCLPCHANHVQNPGLHAHHEPDGEGSRCRSCHIQLLPGSHMELADHTLSIPVPENTIRYNSPNACNDCHTDQTPQWSVRWLEEWYGPDRIDRWSRAEVLFKAKNLDTAAVVPLIAMLRDTSENMIWRSNAALMLGGFGDRRAIAPLMEYMTHSNTVLRTNALQSLAKFPDERVRAALRRHILTEPNSQIRLHLAGKLDFWWRDDLTAPERRIAQQSWEQYVRQATTVLGDWAEARRELAVAYSRRGEIQNAEREYTYALNIDSTDAQSEDGLAALYTQQERYADALVHARRAVVLDTASAAFRVNLAAAYMYVDSLARAEVEFRRVLETAPDMSVAGLNLAMLLQQQNRFREAHEVLRGIVAQNTRNGQAQYMLGASAMQLGMRQEAAQALSNVLALSPPPQLRQEIQQRLAAIMPPGTPLPRPDIDTNVPERVAPQALGLDPEETWPIRHWQNFTPRTTPEQVAALAIPHDISVRLDSARSWVFKADHRHLRQETRIAYGRKGLRLIDMVLVQSGAEPGHIATAGIIKGHGSAALATLMADEHAEDSLLAMAQSALDGVDTVQVRQMNGAVTALGKAYYRLARSYDHVQNYRAAIPAFIRAASFLPGTFSEAIAWFFVGTSYDRLGNRAEAVAAYARSAAHPNNSARGIRCSEHGMKHPFRFMPPFKGF